MERPAAGLGPAKPIQLPRTAAGSQVVDDENGRRTVTAPKSALEGLGRSLSNADKELQETIDSNPQNPAIPPLQLASVSNPPVHPDSAKWGERQPLASIADLHDMMLVRKRTAKNDPKEDNWMPRTNPKVERLPADHLTAEGLSIYLEELAVCGLHGEAARRARLGLRSIQSFRKRTPEFEELVQEALLRFREQVEAEVYRRAVTGWEEPVFGGQWKDRVVGTIRRYDSRLLELLAKRHIPDYRDKNESTVNVTGGVLLVPTTNLSAQDWAKTHAIAPDVPSEDQGRENVKVVPGSGGQS